MKNYSKSELQSMSDWNLVQIYCDEMGGIDENDLMIEVRGNKEERENLISQLLQRMKSKYKDGGGVGNNYVAVHESKDGYWTIVSKPTTKSKAILFKGSEPKNETFKVVSLNQALNHKKVVGKEYLMKNGGGIDINELNMPVIRTQFEDEEYEFKDGGNVKVGDKVMLPEIKMRDGKIQFEKVENGEVLYIENGIYGVLNPKTKRIHQVSLNQIKFENGGTTKGFEYSIGGL